MEPAATATAERRPDSAAGRPAWSPADPAEYAGRYYSEELDATYEIELDGDTLELKVGDWLGTLVPAEPDVFRAAPLTLRFLRGARGRIGALLVDAGRVRGIRFERR